MAKEYIKPDNPKEAQVVSASSTVKVTETIKKDDDPTSKYRDHADDYLPPRVKNVSKDNIEAIEEPIQARIKVVTTGDNQEHNYMTGFTYDKDANDAMGTGTLEMPYHPNLWMYWEPGLHEITVWGGTYEKKRLFFGRVREASQDGDLIKLSLQDCGWRLKQDIDPEDLESIEDDTPLREAFTQLMNWAGMKPIILGLTQDYRFHVGDHHPTPTTTSDTPVSAYDKTWGEAVKPKLSTAPQNANALAAGGGDVVTAIAKPSCINCAVRGFQYTYYRASFVNRCGHARCSKVGTLRWNRKGVPEGEWTCEMSLGGCDGDWCGVCGGEKWRPQRGFLTPVGEPQRVNASAVSASWQIGMNVVAAASPTRIAPYTPPPSRASRVASSALSTIRAQPAVQIASRLLSRWL